MINYTSNLFILNPLTAIFLSGVATQITFILFFNNNHTVIKKSTLIYSNSDRRIKQWQQMFNDYCCKYYEQYSETYEKEEFHSTTELNPFVVHSNLLIRYSTIMLEFLRFEKIGNITKDNIKKWFLLIGHIKDSKLWLKHMSKTNATKLLDLENEHASTSFEGTGCDIVKEFIGFNPVALFMRSSFIVNIHQSSFSFKLFNFWEKCNTLFFSKHFCIQEYVKEMSRDEKPLHFSPEFPLINHLPCKGIYEMWNLSAQKTSPIPVYKIHQYILEIIFGNMMTSHYHQRNQFNLPSENETANVTIFQKFHSQIKLSMGENLKNIQNNEKQRRFQLKKNQKGYKNTDNYFDHPPWGFPLFFKTYSEQRFEWRIDGNFQQISYCKTASQGVFASSVACAMDNDELNQSKRARLHRHSPRINMKKIDYTELDETNEIGEEELFSKRIIVKRTQRTCMNKNDNTEQQDDDDKDDQQHHEKIFARRSQRSRILELHAHDIQFSTKRLIDEDVTINKDLQTMNKVNTRKGCASNLDNAIIQKNLQTIKNVSLRNKRACNLVGLGNKRKTSFLNTNAVQKKSMTSWKGATILTMKSNNDGTNDVNDGGGKMTAKDKDEYDQCISKNKKFTEKYNRE